MADMGQSEEMMESNQTNERNGDANEDDRKIFVGGINWTTTESELREYMEKFGKVVKCTLKKDAETGRARGFGFVVFEEASTVDEVINHDTHMLNDKKIDPKRADPLGKSQDPPVKKIYVGKVSPSTTEDAIKEYFNQYGTVTKIEAPFDKQNDQRKNFVFVEFDSTEAVQKILSICDENPEYKHKIGSDEIDIRKATPTQRTRGRGGFQRGGDRGRGGRGGYGGNNGGWGQGYNQGYGDGGYGYGGYGGYGGGYEGYGGYGYGSYGSGYDYNAWGGYGGGYGNYGGYGGYGGGQYDWGWGGNYGESGQQNSNYGKAKTSRGGSGGGGGGGQGYRPY